MKKQIFLILLVVAAFSFIRLVLTPSFNPNDASQRIEKADDRFFSSQTAGHPWILLEFWARNCPHCLRMKPDINEIADHYEDRLKVLSVDMLNTREIPRRYGVQSTPTLVLLRGGHEIARRSGAASASELKNWIDSALPRDNRSG